MTLYYSLLAVTIAVIFVFFVEMSRRDRIIQRQQDTIQRLINREPVTYAETGETPRKPIKERFSAWGNQTFHLDEDFEQERG